MILSKPASLDLLPSLTDPSSSSILQTLVEARDAEEPLCWDPCEEEKMPLNQKPTTLQYMFSVWQK